jgi:hypothetical protein
MADLARTSLFSQVSIPDGVPLAPLPRHRFRQWGADVLLGIACGTMFVHLIAVTTEVSRIFMASSRSRDHGGRMPWWRSLHCSDTQHLTG